MNERNRAGERVSESNAAPIETASLLDGPTTDRYRVTYLFRAFCRSNQKRSSHVSALLSLVLISAVLAVASRGRTLTIALLLAIPAVAVTLPPSLMVELLVETINIAAIAQEKKRGKRLERLNPAPESLTIGYSMPLLYHQ